MAHRAPRHISKHARIMALVADLDLAERLVSLVGQLQTETDRLRHSVEAHSRLVQGMALKDMGVVLVMVRTDMRAKTPQPPRLPDTAQVVMAG
jgi:hypothetical protein